MTTTEASSGNSYQFTGREHDGTGLFYYRAQYYDPLLQRSISENPIEFAGGDPNLYAYVFNSPTNFIDPSGLLVVGGGVGGSYATGGGVDVAGGVVVDSSKNTWNLCLCWRFGRPQFAASGGRTAFVAPFADDISDLQGSSLDIHISPRRLVMNARYLTWALCIHPP